MTSPFIILLAIVWGIFGLWGFLRGWKSALVMLVMIVGSLLLLSIAPEKVAEMFDYINKAVAMATGGNKDFINTAPSSLVVIILNGAVILGFLLGLLRIFRTKPSFSGFLLGFINGYFYTAYMLAALVPQWAILPLPIKIPGLTIRPAVNRRPRRRPARVCPAPSWSGIETALRGAMPAVRDRCRHLSIYLADRPHRESKQPEGVNPMSPVDLVFLIVILLFGIIGIVRGVAKELGVTVMLLARADGLAADWVSMFLPQITSMLNQVFGISPDQRAEIFVAMLPIAS